VNTTNKRRQPAVFFGHGSPMNAIRQTCNSAAWSVFGQRFFGGAHAPAAILCISAHWYGPGTAVTASPAPQTIHDFGGFPQELFDVQYPAPGDPELARHIADLLAPLPVQLDPQWGLDHGVWSVLVHAGGVAGGTDAGALPASFICTRCATTRR
jgi:4,5-DOPA dioxygenase extradiol